MRWASGERALPGAGARQPGPLQGGQSREAGAAQSAGRSAPGNSPGAPARNTASPAADADKAPYSLPLRPQPRGPLRSVTRTARARSGFHWWARQRPAPPTARGSPAPSLEQGCCVGEPPAGPRRGARGACSASVGRDTGDSSLFSVPNPAMQSAADTGRRQLPARPQRHPACSTVPERLVPLPKISGSCF